MIHEQSIPDARLVLALPRNSPFCSRSSVQFNSAVFLKRGKGWIDNVKEYKKGKGAGDGGQAWKKKTTWQSGGAWNAH